MNPFIMIKSIFILPSRTVVEIDFSPHDPNQESPSASLHLQNKNIEELKWKKHLVQH